MKKMLKPLAILGVIVFAGAKTMESCDWQIAGNEEKIAFMILILLIGVMNLAVSLVDIAKRKKAKI